MITLTLLGSVALLWVVIHFIWRQKKAQRNPYSRFLRDQTVEDVRIDNIRSLKLRIATQQTASESKNGSNLREVATDAHDTES